MAGKIALLSDPDEDSHASVRVTRRGQCELIFRSNESRCTFPISLSSLINVGLGARTHLASDFGACALTKTPGGVKITLTPWGADLLEYLVPMNLYADALDDLTLATIVQKKVSLH